MYTTYSYSTVPETSGAGVWGIIALVISIIGAVLVYFLFVNSKTDVKGKFVKWLKDFLSFKIMWIEPIMKMIYYFATIFLILSSFAFLQYGGSGVLYFFLTLIAGPIIVRVLYELMMMLIMIWRNTRDIAENTSNKKK